MSIMKTHCGYTANSKRPWLMWPTEDAGSGWKAPALTGKVPGRVAGMVGERFVSGADVPRTSSLCSCQSFTDVAHRLTAALTIIPRQLILVSLIMAMHPMCFKTYYLSPGTYILIPSSRRLHSFPTYLPHTSSSS
jgi:hypothetical protein